MSRHRHRVALALAAAVLAACSDANTPTAATVAAPVARVAPSLEQAELGVVTRQVGELDRIADAYAGSQAALDSLQQLWTAAPTTFQRTSAALRCVPSRYDADVKVVGPRGGVLRAGRHTLTIPAGALREPTVITMEAPVSLAVAVHFEPHGLTFDVAPTLTLDYRKCAVPDGSAMSIAYVDDALNVLERPRSKQAKGRKGTISAEIWHFSDYIIAW